MEAGTSVCGIYECNTCEHRTADACLGCRRGNAVLRRSGVDECAVYACAEGRGIGSCKECAEAACGLRWKVETICPLRSRFEKKRWWAGRMSRALGGRRGQNDSGGKAPEKVINRLRCYLTALDSFASDNYDAVSSWQLAERVGVSAALIRKDLSRFGEFGTPSYGYKLGFLRERLCDILGLDRSRGLAWVGACALRHNMIAIDRLSSNHCRIEAVFDIDDKEIGGGVGEFTVLAADAIRETLSGANVSAAVIAVSGPRVQEIAGALVEMGAKAILNLSGQMLVLPDGVRLRNVDLVGELIELCYYCGK